MACRTLAGCASRWGVTAQISRVPMVHCGNSRTRRPDASASCTSRLPISATPRPASHICWMDNWLLLTMRGSTRRLRAAPSGPLRSSSRPPPSRAKPSQPWASRASGVSGLPCRSRYSGEAHSHHSSAPSLRAAQVESARRPKRTARSTRALMRSMGASSTSNRSRNEGYCASIAPRAGETCRAKPTVADMRSSPLGASRAAASSARACSAAAHMAAHWAW